MAQASRSNAEKETVVGFEDETETLLQQLTGISTKLEVISIVGMAGLGKTTLAEKLYNHPSITYHFYIRAWTSVSQAYQKRHLLLGLLKSVSEPTDEIYRLSDEKLGQFLYHRLKGQRYLVVLDDIWNIGPWNDLKRSFPDDNIGSKIMFTSRLIDVASQVQPKKHILSMRFLTENESWILLQQKVFQKETCPSDLLSIGKEIARKCQGLPLAIIVIAGLLTSQKTRDWWVQVAENVGSYIVSDPEQYMDTPALSYNHLPYHLKVCFLYFGAFFRDYEIPVRKLIWSWIAEGFIRQIGEKSLEDVAGDYLMDLRKRSLIIQTRRGSNGGMKMCRLHDMLRDLCLRKAKEGNFSPKIYRYGQVYSHSSSSSNSAYRQRGSNIRPFHSPLCFDVEMCNSLLDDVCQAFQLLKVLDLSPITLLFFPSEVVELVHLRYIQIKAENGSPPASISDLLNRRTLIISSRRCITTPRNTWKLVNLRHLYIKSTENLIEDPFFEEASTNDGYPSILENLHTMSQVCPSKSCHDVLARTPNLKKLGFCGRLVSTLGNLTFPNLFLLDRLESLKLLNTTAIVRHKLSRSCNPIMFPERLKSLTLLNTCLEWNEMWTFGMLPNLEVLKLKFHACLGREWETSDGGFRQLKFLKLQDLDIVQWNASSNHFPSLQRLVMHRCHELEEIPSGLGYIPTIEMIEVSWCMESALNSVRKIQKVQKSEGNDYLKIIIGPHGEFCNHEK